MQCLRLTVLCVFIQVAYGQIEQLNPELSSTESTITVTWNIINPVNDTKYMLKHHRSKGIWITDLYFHAPFDRTHIEHTITDLFPGISYSVYIFRNTNTSEGRIFDEDIATVPLAPVDLKVDGAGSTWLNLSWSEDYNSTQDSHEIIFTDLQNSGTRTVNGTGDLNFNLTGLDPGHRYAINVKAVTAGIKSNLSEPLQATTVPAAPSTVVISAVNTTHLTANWEPGANSLQDGYRVSSITRDKTEEANSTCPPNPPCVFAPEGLPGDLYTINIYALRDNRTSQPASGQHNTRPKPVTDLQGSAGVRSVQVTWKAPDHSTIDYYRLRVVDTQTTSPLVFNASKDSGTDGAFTFNEPSLQGGVTYNVHVFSAVETEQSIDKNLMLVTLPEPVSDLKGTALNTSAITLTWTLPRNSHIEQIHVMVSKPSGDVINITLGEEETRTTIVNLLPAAVYDVSVYLLTKIVTSTAVTGQFRTKPNPPAVSSLHVSETSAFVSLSATGEGEPDYFVVSVSDQQGDRNVSLVNPTVMFRELQPGVEYTLNTFSVSGDQNSEIVARTFYTKPRPPTAVNVTAFNSTAIDVSWMQPSSGSYDNFTVTLVQAEGASPPVTGTTSNMFYAFPMVEAGETYNITVVTNLGNESSQSELKQVTTTPFPIALIWVSSRGSTQVIVNWDEPAGTSYDYFMFDFPKGNKSMQELPAHQLELVLDNLEPGADYSFTLYAVSRGIKDDLLSAGVSLNFTTYPTSVATLQKIEANTSAIHINWTSPDASQSFDYFFLTIFPRDGAVYNTTRGAGDHTYWFGGLRPGQMYNITITTVKERHIGPQTEYNFGMTTFILAVTEPMAVSTLDVISVDDETLNINWTSNPTSQQDFFLVEYESNGQARNQEVQFEAGRTNYSLVVEQLLSGYTYNVSVKSVRSVPASDTTYSQLQWKTGTTAPKPVLSLTSLVNGRVVSLQWMIAAGSQQDYFRVEFRPVLRNPMSQYIVHNATEPNFDLEGMFPGEQYQINVYAVSINMTSEQTSTTAVIAPLAPTDLAVVTQLTNETSLTLSWTYDRINTFVQHWSVTAYNDTSTLSSVDVEPNGDEIRYTAGNLRPGARYHFDMMAVVEGKESPSQTANSTVKPILDISWEESTQQTTNSSIVFTYSLNGEDDIFNNIVFSVNNSNVANITRPRNTISVISFGTLVAGTLYHVNAVSEVDGMVSSPRTLSIRTVPNVVPVQLVSTFNQVILNLLDLKGNADKFHIYCRKIDGSSCWNATYPPTTHKVTVEGLSPFTNHTIVVTTIAGEKSQSETLTIATKQAPPSKVRNVNAVEQSKRAVRVTWDAPQFLNGVLNNYLISYSGHDPSINGPDHNSSDAMSVSASTTSYNLEGLRAGFQYTIMVRAVTVQAGMPGETQVTLKTTAPQFKSGSSPETAKPRKAKAGDGIIGETSLKVTFENAFSEENGRIIQYTVIVSTSSEETDELSSHKLPSWSQAQKGSVSTYQTIQNCSDFFQESSVCGLPGRRKRAAEEQPYKIFHVGAETSCTGKEYCNGPLKPDTGYYFKLRAYTNNGFTDTAYSQAIRTAAEPSNAGGIVGGVIAAIIIIAIIAAVLIFLRRRRPKRAHKYIGDRTTIEQSSMHKFSRPVKIAEFRDHVRRMAADSDFRYAEEYEDLKEVGRDQACLAAELPANRPKNRFTNILPYDHSRVKLLPTDDEEGTDYINSNYVPGFTSKREYIATQGPLPSTRDDFWRMLWEQNSRNIVMLTKCMEKGREKSDHYWPNDSEPKFYGDLQVAILNETHLPDWTISEFKVQLGEQARQIRHFHYKAWPDFGVPKDPTSLLRFVRSVREKMFREGGPIITHCSAGVGRSGTFIVLDHCLQRIKEHDNVDIYQIVYKMRKERVLMVQTEQQYKFIHECLLCVLEGREDEATYANVGHLNVAFDDDEGINVEQP